MVGHLIRCVTRNGVIVQDPETEEGYMRKIVAALFAVMMLIGSTANIAMAQEAGTPEVADGASGGDTSFATGLDAEATYFSERGDPIATLKVVDVERGWQEFGEFYEPDPGVEYVAVTFEVASVARGNLVVEPCSFSLINSIGRNTSSAFVDAAEDSDVELLEEDAAVATGETAEFTMIFEIFEEDDLGYFMWQLDSGVILLVDLTEI